MEERLRLVRIEKYGPGNEKLSDTQLELLELEPGVSSAEVEAESQREQLQPPLKATRKHPGRQELLAELPIVEQMIACTADQCHCGKCGKETIVIGYETSEQLDVEPAKYFQAVQLNGKDLVALGRAVENDKLFELEAEAKAAGLGAQERLELRRQKSEPVFAVSRAELNRPGHRCCLVGLWATLATMSWAGGVSYDAFWITAKLIRPGWSHCSCSQRTTDASEIVRVRMVCL